MSNVNINPSPEKDHKLLHNATALMNHMLTHTCGRHAYKTSFRGREYEAVVYTYDAHCVEYEVHVIHGAHYDGVKHTEPLIIKVLTRVT